MTAGMLTICAGEHEIVCFSDFGSMATLRPYREAHM